MLLTSVEDKYCRNEQGLDIEKLLGLTSDETETKSLYKIGELSREFGVTLRSLRFYEDKGFLHPTRQGLTRLYSATDRQRLRIILLSKALGFTLQEARELISLYTSPKSERQKAEATLERFAEQRTELYDQRQNIDQSIQTLEESIKALENQLVTLPQ